MTVEMEFSSAQAINLGQWQVGLARDLVEQAGYEWSNIERVAQQNTLIVRHTGIDTITDQEEQAVLGFVNSYLPTTVHVETRENVDNLPSTL